MLKKRRQRLNCVTQRAALFPILPPEEEAHNLQEASLKTVLCLYIPIYTIHIIHVHRLKALFRKLVDGKNGSI
jgi:hypothetical protein